ncbi:MAG: hypothetical protein Q8N53_02740 [Longimicrobiales bacterium]|nr:hypothetical protein [Longimicrobiales bacterium]
MYAKPGRVGWLAKLPEASRAAEVLYEEHDGLVVLQAKAGCSPTYA